MQNELPTEWLSAFGYLVIKLMPQAGEITWHGSRKVLNSPFLPGRVIIM